MPTYQAIVEFHASNDSAAALALQRVSARFTGVRSLELTRARRAVHGLYWATVKKEKK